MILFVRGRNNGTNRWPTFVAIVFSVWNHEGWLSRWNKCDMQIDRPANCGDAQVKKQSEKIFQSVGHAHCLPRAHHIKETQLKAVPADLFSKWKQYGRDCDKPASNTRFANERKQNSWKWASVSTFCWNGKRRAQITMYRCIPKAHRASSLANKE